MPEWTERPFLQVTPTAVASRRGPGDNWGMVITGSIHNGVVVLEGGISLPEGVRVQVILTSETQPAKKSGQRVKLPIFDSGEPPFIDLTNDQIADILDREDAAQWRLLEN
jgi:hypothetical protein